MSAAGAKSWDYNKEGVAHYGLLPDFIMDLKNLGGDNELEELFKSAEYFTKMWEKCEDLSDINKTAEKVENF